VSAGVLSVRRHGVELRFDDDGFIETPYVYRPMLKGQVYEETFLEHIRSLAVAGTYVDVGAHLGTHSIWFAALCPATHVHAFEPVGRFADVVRRNVALNGMQDRVTVHQVGLSDAAGDATNRLSPEHQMGFVDVAEARDETFPIMRLDDVLRRRQIALMKLDVEGMEAAVLRGAKRMLSRHRPVVYAEAHDSAALVGITAALAPSGYQATGRVFNSSPTHEFAAPPRKRWQPFARVPPPA
jgi:FkbM family methyltransferase